jgi:hypothetical protein
MLVKSLQFLALFLTTLALLPGGAHFFELPNKIGMPQEQYFTVQGIYAGWALFGFVLIPAVLANFALAYVLRDQRWPAVVALAAGVLTMTTLVTFFVWVQPANVATSFWTTAPDNGQTLRSQWEYTHAMNAVLTFAAFCALTLALIIRR